MTGVDHWWSAHSLDEGSSLPWSRRSLPSRFGFQFLVVGLDGLDEEVLFLPGGPDKAR